MRRRLALIALSLGASVILAACGTGTNLSADYCKRLPGGRWVTNNSAEAPCVPNPADATGNANADGSVPLPRCASCKLSEWNQAELRAEARAAAAKQAAATEQASVAAATRATASGKGSGSRWPADARTSFVNACTLTSGGRAQACGCIADHLSRTVSIEQLPHMELVDRRLYSAIAACEQL
jgi:hypothetical protein